MSPKNLNQCRLSPRQFYTHSQCIQGQTPMLAFSISLLPVELSSFPLLPGFVIAVKRNRFGGIEDHG